MDLFLLHDINGAPLADIVEVPLTHYLYLLRDPNEIFEGAIEVALTAQAEGNNTALEAHTEAAEDQSRQGEETTGVMVIPVELPPRFEYSQSCLKAEQEFHDI
ncbi:hypothetical protein MFIFM68171_03519 [Madurella fahalii]|uniref:Uncharacterized protein n=1 Tax=Madurella fahalii TaxID=1157608 RepID=A0ABQ0G6B7_9PEZI